MILIRSFALFILFCGVIFSCINHNDSATAENSLEIVKRSVEIHELVWNSAERVMLHADIPFSGQAVVYKDTARAFPISETNYLNGRKAGLERKWFDNAKISYECEYLDGKKNGYSKSWWNNGKLRSHSNFLDGKGHGLQEQWYRSGSLFKRRHLSQGLEDGMQQSWRENGKIYNNYEAKNGRIFGLKRASLCFKLEDEVVIYED